MQRGRSIWGVYMQEKYLCTNLGVKEGGGILLEGGIFLWELMVHPINNPCVYKVSREKQENGKRHSSHQMNTWEVEGPKNKNREAWEMWMEMIEVVEYRK